MGLAVAHNLLVPLILSRLQSLRLAVGAVVGMVEVVAMVEETLQRLSPHPQVVEGLWSHPYPSFRAQRLQVPLPDSPLVHLAQITAAVWPVQAVAEVVDKRCQSMLRLSHPPQPLPLTARLPLLL